MSCVDLTEAVTGASPERRRATLSTRLSRLYFGMSLLLIVMGCSVVYMGVLATLAATDYQILEKRLLTLKDVLDDSGTTESDIAHEVSEDLEGPRRIYMRIVTASELIAVSTPEMPEVLRADLFPNVQSSPFDHIGQGTIKSSNGQYYRTVSARIRLPERWQSRTAILQVAVDTSRDELILGWLRRVLAFTICLLALMCWLLVHYLVRRELRPLQGITNAASHIESQNLHYRLQLSDLPAELDELAEQFNQMLDRLQSAYGRLRHYADEVAHELRSPINRMLLGTEVILRQPRANDEYRELLGLNLEECQNLACMVDRLLFLARAENTCMSLAPSKTLLSEELEVLQDFFCAAGDAKGIKLNIECSPTLILEIDRILFRRAISNLVANAIDHTPAGGSISLAGFSQSDNVVIKVTDTGEGIPLSAQPYVFDRFYMVNEARSSSGSRVGLGLAITKSIISLHGGEISIESAPGSGTCVCINLPQAAKCARAGITPV